MNPWAIPSLAAFIITLALGIYILYIEPKARLNQTFFILLFFCTIWAFGEMLERSAPNVQVALICARYLYLGAAFIGPAVLHFSIIYTMPVTKTMALPKWKFLSLCLLYGISIIFLYFAIATELFIRDIEKAPWGYHELYGLIFGLFSIYLSSCLIAGLIIVFCSYRKARTLIEKKQRGLVTISLFMPIAAGLTTNLMLPSIGIETAAFATLFTAIACIFVVYAILKYKLFVIEPSAEELIETPQKYPLEKGLGYFVKEKKLDKSYEIFYDQVTHGISGLCITKLPPEKVRERYKIEKSPILWLTFKEVEDAISPKDVEGLKFTVSDFVGKAEKPVILLDCFDQIMLANGFEKAEGLLREVKDICRKNNANLLLSINPEMFEEKQISAIEKELERVGV